MPDVIIIGDGPGGLSAALFLAKAGKEVVVYGQDKTAMHAAMLYNYLGIPEISGADFQRVARTQVSERGGRIVDARVRAVHANTPGFTIELEDGSTASASTLILSEGKGAPLARALGLEPDASGAIPVDHHGHAGLEGVYVIGRSARPGRSQAIISAGDGAAAALDILSRERGQDVADWDVPAKG